MACIVIRVSSYIIASASDRTLPDDCCWRENEHGSVSQSRLSRLTCTSVPEPCRQAPCSSRLRRLAAGCQDSRARRTRKTPAAGARAHVRPLRGRTKGWPDGRRDDERLIWRLRARHVPHAKCTPSSKETRRRTLKSTTKSTHKCFIGRRETP